MPTLGFAAALRDFEVRTTEKIDAVLQGATRDILRQANTPQPGVRFTGGSFHQGRVPVDLGNLYESLTLAVDGGFVATGPTAYEAIGVFRIGSVLFAGWTAKNERGQEYGVFVEYGTRYIRPRYFVTLAVQEWQSAVAAHASRIAGR